MDSSGQTHGMRIGTHPESTSHFAWPLHNGTINLPDPRYREPEGKYSVGEDIVVSL
jgi:hypothetical protein